MTTYPAVKGSLKRLTLYFFILLAMTIFSLLWIKGSAFRLILLVLMGSLLHLLYQGMIVNIQVSSRELLIKRLFHTTKFNIEDIAFCAVHGIDQNKFLIYCFVRKRVFGRERIAGIKSKLSFDEVVALMAQDDGRGATNMDINFHQAKKIPTAFVENAEALKDQLLLAVDAAHLARGRLN